ncbi:MAG: dienelactone hydrolase family protein [Chitinispirillales bacterium]|nr:dienelactone hydrolase family protein [Chitinispirillales bacterium]
MKKVIVILIVFAFISCKKDKNLSEIGNLPDSSNFALKIKLPNENIEWILGIHAIKNAAKPLPLIVYLHGGIGANRNDKGEKAFEMMNFIYDSIPIFAVSPSSDLQNPWWSSNGVERIKFAVKYMTNNYNIDTSKIFLCGVSDGAAGIFYFAATQDYPLFARYFAISGFGEMILGDPPIITQSLRKSKIYIVNAGNDRLYPAERTKSFAQNLINDGIDVEFKFYENEEHGFDYKQKEFDNFVQRMGLFYLQK